MVTRSLFSSRPEDRVKMNRHDAITLAKLTRAQRSGETTAGLPEKLTAECPTPPIDRCETWCTRGLRAQRVPPQHLQRALLHHRRIHRGVRAGPGVLALADQGPLGRPAQQTYYIDGSRTPRWGFNAWRA